MGSSKYITRFVFRLRDLLATFEIIAAAFADRDWICDSTLR